MEILYAIIAFVALTAIFTFFGMRQRAAAWRGVVTDIREHTYWKNEVQEEEMIISYRTDAGKKGKLKMNTWAYNQNYAGLQVGDRLVKESGQYMPRVEKAEGAASA